jgi:hypothetical protein
MQAYTCTPYIAVFVRVTTVAKLRCEFTAFKFCCKLAAAAACAACWQMLTGVVADAK